MSNEISGGIKNKMSLTAHNDISWAANLLSSYDNAHEAIDYVKIYVNMVAFDDESAELVALAKAIEMWRQCSYGSQRSLLQEQAQMTPTVISNLMTSYIVGEDHVLKPSQPLLVQQMNKSYNAQGQKRKEQRNSIIAKCSAEVKTLNDLVIRDQALVEANLVMYLFKLFNMLHYYVHNELPTPFGNNEDYKKNPDRDLYEFLYGKFSIHALPATLCLQEQCKRAIKSTKIFLFQRQINIDKLKLEDLALHTECQNSLNQLQVILVELFNFSKQRLAYYNGTFKDAHQHNMAKELTFVLEQLIEKVRESNINVHLFKWEIARRKQVVGAWFSAEEEAQILAAYENENAKFDAVERLVRDDTCNNEMQSALDDVNEVAVATVEDCEYAQHANGPVASTALFNFERRHGS